MSKLRRIRLSNDLAAPVPTVFRGMLGDAGYHLWTRPSAEDTHFVGRWQAGEQIRFMSPSDDGTLAKVAALRPGEPVSIRHLGTIRQGVLGTQSAAVRAWTPACENDPFHATPAGVRVVMDHDATPEAEPCLREARRRSLQQLKARYKGNA